MGHRTTQPEAISPWALVKRQHGVLARGQLLELGFGPKVIKHRVTVGRLYQVHRGVYAVGRPQLTVHGRWMAAVLRCGEAAVLSHQSAAALWRIRPVTKDEIEVSVSVRTSSRPPGIAVHRRAALAPDDVTRHDGIPTTTPICTLIDIAAQLNRDQLEAAINEADKLDLTTPVELRAALDKTSRRQGIRSLRELLDRRTFTLTDSELERRFLRLVRSAGLPAPETGRYVNGFKVDFYWPHLGLVVETDGLR